ncbi:MAG: MotA/TolQ/ExbB proton channel family protein [Candidatus Omnitrophota bacterium]
MFRKRGIVKTLLAVVFVVFIFTCLGYAQAGSKVEKYIPDSASAEEGMTLWQSIKAGGETMVVLALLSVAAISLVIYYFMTIQPDKLLPPDFLEESVSFLENKQYGEIKKQCVRKQNLIAGLLNSGILCMGRGKSVIKEAMQDEGKRIAGSLWQRLSYLADVAAIAPMVGLLGTVLGMIQAFNVIAFQTGAVKPILLASGISKAMITTATGLIIAIPAMIFYSFFKGKVQNVISRLEDVSTELYNLMTEEKV